MQEKLKKNQYKKGQKISKYLYAVFIHIYHFICIFYIVFILNFIGFHLRFFGMLIVVYSVFIGFNLHFTSIQFLFIALYSFHLRFFLISQNQGLNGIFSVPNITTTSYSLEKKQKLFS